MKPYKNLTGRKFGRLTVIAIGEKGIRKNGKSRGYKWVCKCSCGGEVSVIVESLLKKNGTQSCGCLHYEEFSLPNTTHGEAGVETKTAEYQTWLGIKARCNNPGGEHFKHYGGRGIKVCDRWMNSFENFLSDMGRRPDGMTIERKNTNGDYSQDNCVWATMRDQQNNRRNNHRIECFGTTRTLAEWGRATGISDQIIWKRLKRGWSIKRSLTIQPTANRKY